jgi:hypothetical protein
MRAQLRYLRTAMMCRAAFLDTVKRRRLFQAAMGA